MATVKFDEGTKVETSLDLEEGEGVLFVRPGETGAVFNVGSSGNIKLGGLF